MIFFWRATVGFFYPHFLVNHFPQRVHGDGWCSRGTCEDSGHVRCARGAEGVWGCESCASCGASKGRSFWEMFVFLGCASSTFNPYPTPSPQGVCRNLLVSYGSEVGIGNICVRDEKDVGDDHICGVAGLLGRRAVCRCQVLRDFVQLLGPSDHRRRNCVSWCIGCEREGDGHARVGRERPRLHVVCAVINALMYLRKALFFSRYLL